MNRKSINRKSPSTFRRYHPKLQRWVERQGWKKLRPVQKRAAPPLLEEEKDVVISAATAAGKTEAAMLPVATRVAEDWAEDDLEAFSVLYISPLKALINDQFGRLDEIFSPLHVPVHRWHGDVASSRKQKARRKGGVLLITPESLEAQFIRRGHAFSDLVAPLRFIVIDELHAFIGRERGRQLQSLLHRVELAARKRVPRVGLSATLGDIGLASQFLRPGHGEEVVQIVDKSRDREVQLRVRAYEKPAGRKGARQTGFSDQEGDSQRDSPKGRAVLGTDVEIAQDLFKALRGGRHIVFANRRRETERFGALLSRISEQKNAADSFFVHHGSLDRQLRKQAEKRLRGGGKPVTLIATSTLELGIDVGSVESIGQVGPPPSVASMHQRLGRSGRQGGPATLRIYLREPPLKEARSPVDRLRVPLVRSVAMVRLLRQGWIEPPVPGALHLSTLVQQILSLVSQHGGVRASQGYGALCKHGPFRGVAPDQFARILRDLGEADLIKQSNDGALVLDLDGERLVNRYDFYSAFSSPREFQLEVEGETIGTVPISEPVTMEGEQLVFGGKAWKVLNIDFEKNVVQLTSAEKGTVPSFTGLRFTGKSGSLLRRKVREEMRSVYAKQELPSFLDQKAAALLQEAREEYEKLGVRQRGRVRQNNETWWFPWVGDRALNAIQLELKARDVNAAQEGPALRLEGNGEIQDVLEAVSEEGFSDGDALARLVDDKDSEKHHQYLEENLLASDYASRALNFRAARAAISAATQT